MNNSENKLKRKTFHGVHSQKLSLFAAMIVFLFSNNEFDFTAINLNSLFVFHVCLCLSHSHAPLKMVPQELFSGKSLATCCHDDFSPFFTRFQNTSQNKLIPRSVLDYLLQRLISGGKSIFHQTHSRCDRLARKERSTFENTQSSNRFFYKSSSGFGTWTYAQSSAAFFCCNSTKVAFKLRTTH